MTYPKTDQDLQGTLAHYGVKGMKWDESKKGKRGKKDLRGIPTSGTVGDVIAKYDGADGSTKKPSAYGARDLRSDADRFIGRIVDRENQKDPNFAKPRFKTDLTTKELIARSEERKRERRRRENKKKHEQRGLTQSSLSEDSIDDTLKHYGVKGMKWGVRKDKRGAVKSVVRRAPLQGSNEFDGPNADGKAQLVKMYAGRGTLKRLKANYAGARRPINQGLKTLNKSEKYAGKDLTNTRSKIYKEYHKDVSNLVLEKLDASTTLKLRPKDRFVIDGYDYDSRTGKAPRTHMISDQSAYERKSEYSQRAASDILKRHNSMATDVTTGTAKNAQFYGAAALTLALGQPLIAGPLAAVGGVRTYSEVYRRRKTNAATNAFMKSKGVAHADMDSEDEDDGIDYIIRYGVSSSGAIEDIELEAYPKGEADLEHSEITFGEILQHNELYSSNGSIDDYLMHYGVKGMKWGVRKDRGSSGKRKTTSAKSKSKSTDSELKDKVRSIASSVKKNLSAESINKRRVDRVNAKTKKTEAKAARAEEVRKAKEKLTAAKDRKNLAEGKPTSSDKKPTPTKTKTVTSKATGTAGLTNDELKAKVERMELERRYAAATSSSKSSGVVATFAKGAGGKLSARLQAEVANRVFQAVLGGKDAPKAKTKLAETPTPKVAEQVQNITNAAKKNPSSTPPVTAMAMGLVGAASMAASMNKNRSSQKAKFGPRPSGVSDSFSDEIIDGFMNIKNTQYTTARDFNREIELYRRR